jgi:CRP-like cAMP-binding protein
MSALHWRSLDESPALPKPSRSGPEGTSTDCRLVGAHNALLSALPGEALQRLNPCLELVHLPVGKLLCEAGEPMRVAYFPASCIVATSYLMEDGGSAEVALVGSEGMVGVPLLLGATASAVRSCVQSAGLAFKLPVPRLLEEFARGGALTHELLRYAGGYIEQITQTAACNRHGTLEQRLCRWLLLTLDRMRSNELVMTHERIANALGAKREGVTEAAGKLRHEGVIQYRRGHITVLDRPALENRAREFYGMNNRRSDREDLALI